MENESNAKPTHQGSPESFSDKSWREFFVKSRQEEVLRIEETAKFLTGLTSLVLTIFQTAGSNSNVKLVEKAEYSLLGSCLLILSLVISIFIFLPKKYKYNIDVQESRIEAHEKIVNFKRFFLITSIILFLFGLICLSISFGSNLKKSANSDNSIKYVLIYKDSIIVKTIVNPEYIK